MASRFLLQIIDKQTGEAVQLEPGLAAERVFVDDCIAKIMAHKVGWFRSAKTVRQAVIEGIEQAIHELKAQIKKP